MVFSSHLPFYLDPPHNWQQHQQHQLQANGVDPQHAQLPPLPPPPHGGGGGGGIRAGSMADRARLARVQLPEQAQKCPRCDSTNTKFCYYNNYSLSQPRHYCKACRRYWTRGGNLRNVPVGGGCRRNKKNKNNSSRSSSAASAPSPTTTTTTTSNSPKAISPEFSGSLPLQQTPHLPFLTSLPNFSQFGNLGLNFSGIHGHHLGGGGTSMAPTQIDLGLHHHQQQFPFFENPTGLYPFPGSEGIAAASSHYATQRGSAESVRVSQMAPVKEENNNNLGLGGLNLSRPMILGVSEINDNNNGNNHNQFWGGNNWGASDLTGLNSSAANHLL